jgi:NAD(P)H dehydrogenase (quinone)
VANVLVVYYSRTGHVKRMAEEIGAAVKEEGLEVEVKSVDRVKPKDLLDYQGIIMGSPVYYGTMAAELKSLIDESVAYHGRLDGRVGGAFASSANIAGGNETTVIDLLKAMLIHGMIVQGDPEGDHYGPVSIGEPDERSLVQCRRLGVRVAQLVRRLQPQ